jgi:hypothetical protein
MARGAPGEEGYTPQVQPEDLPRKIVPRANEVSAIPAFADAANSIDKKYTADSATWASDQIAQARIKAVQDMDTAKQNAPAGDQTGFTQKYLQQFDKDNQPLMDGLQSGGNPVATQMVRKGLGDLRDTLGQHGLAWEAQQNVAYRTDSFQNNLKSQLPVVEAHPELATQVGSTLNDQLQASGLQPSQRIGPMRVMHEQLSLAAANGLTRQDPQGMLDAIANPDKAPANVRSVLDGLNDVQREGVMAKAKVQLSGQFSNNIVDTYRQQGPAAGAAMLKQVDTSGQTPEIKAQIYSDVEKGLSQWRAEARQTNAQPLMGLEERLASGKPQAGDLNSVLDLYHKGVFTPEQAGEMRGRIEKAQEKQVDDQANLKAATSAYANGQGLDPKNKDHRDGVDSLFTNYTQNVQPGTAEWINRGADIAQKTGITPDSLVAWSRTALVSSNPQTAAQAANALQRQQDANPRGIGYALDPETKAQAKLINDAVHAGSDTTAAVENARKITSMPDADKLRLEELYKQQKVGANTNSALTSELKADPKFATGWFSKSLPVPPVMSGEYEQLRQNYFKLTGGDVKQTNDLAYQDLKNTWGVTKVNGKPEYMQFAPESMNPGLTTDFLRKDMETSAKDRTEDPSKVRLIPTPDTFQSGGQRWGLGVPDKFGAYSALTDKRGNPIPYQLPTAAASFQDTKGKAAQEGMDKLHAIRRVDKDQAEWQQIKSDSYAEQQ